MKRGPAPAPHPDALDEDIIRTMSRTKHSLRSAAYEVGVSYGTVKRRLAILERQGLIERNEAGRVVRANAVAPDVAL